MELLTITTLAAAAAVAIAAASTKVPGRAVAYAVAAAMLSAVALRVPTEDLMPGDNARVSPVVKPTATAATRA